MKNHRLTPEEMKDVAHLMAQRSLASLPPLKWDESTDRYLEVYNQVMDKLEDYNAKN